MLPRFMNFECKSIDSKNGIIFILRELERRVGTKVVGTTIYFTYLFCQFAVAKKDLWEAVIVPNDGILIDKRLHIWRKSSALHGQRLSFLIGELI